MVWCFFYTCPQQNTVAFVERCGRFSHVAQPGCNCLNPFFGQCVAGQLSLRVRQLDVTCETKTRDNVFLTLQLSVQYQVNPDAAYDAFYRLSDSKHQISSYVFDVVRSTVPKMLLDDVFLQKEEVALEVKEQLSKSMGVFGFTIIKTLVNDIIPGPRVKDAMDAMLVAQRLRMAALETAEAHKITIVKAAEAEAEAKHLQGQGISRQRMAIINGLHETVKDFASDVDGVSSRDVLQLMLMTQYFDMLRDVGANGKSNTVFMTHGPGSVGEVGEQMRKAMMEAQAGSSSVGARVAAAPQQQMQR